MRHHDMAAQDAPRTIDDSHLLLDVEGLTVTHNRTGARVVDAIALSIGRGESVALVGESGSGKSMTAKALLALLPREMSATGTVHLAGEELPDLSEKHLRGLRGDRLGLLMQDPFTMLNPLTTVGTHLIETLRSRPSTSRASSSTEEIDRRLVEVGIVDPAVSRKYPFELSGGMRQRVALATALAKDPELLIADEPTTALDNTTQREVLRLLRRIQRDRGMGLLLITHDLKVAFAVCDRIMVMRAGRIVEVGDPDTLRSSPQADYTAKLLSADLSIDGPLEGTRAEKDVSEDGAPQVLLEVSHLTKQFGQARRRRRRSSATSLPALDDASLRIVRGRSLGLVGESGSGKSTMARCILGLEVPTSGTIRMEGLALDAHASMTTEELRRARGAVQCIFQDPYSTLNPAHSIGFILTEAIRHRGGAPSDVSTAEEVEGLLTKVGLPADFARRTPSALSGGQRQRVSIARALAMRPRLLVCDESLSALDVSVQAQVLELLDGLRDQGVTLLFITHDLAVARRVTDDLVVLYRGRVVESGPTDEVLSRPQHAYTRQLVEAVPTGEPAWLA